LTKVGAVYWLISLVVDGRHVDADTALRHALRTRRCIATYPSLAAYAAEHCKPELLDREPEKGSRAAPENSGGLCSSMGADAAVRR
jgi:hypothetical protein